MQRLYDKVRSIQKVYTDLDKHIAKFQSKSGLRCNNGCSLCCAKPDIEASVTEFLPFAYDLYKKNELYTFLDKIESDPESNFCMLYNPLNILGGCTHYANRGLICRLFGFSARLNRFGKKELVTCKIIKTELSENISQVNDNLEKINLPIMRDYYFRLQNIDMNLSSKLYPINTAIRKAVEYVANYYYYRNKRAA